MKTIQILFFLILPIVGVKAQYNYEWERHDINSKSSIRGLHAVNKEVVWVGGS